MARNMNQSENRMPSQTQSRNTNIMNYNTVGPTFMEAVETSSTGGTTVKRRQSPQLRRGQSVEGKQRMGSNQSLGNTQKVKKRVNSTKKTND